MKAIHPGVFRAYDIRGIVDRDFDPEWVRRLGRALGTYFAAKGRDRVALGHDCRLSSPVYRDCLAEGLTGCGLDVVDIGMVPSGVFYFAVKTLGCQAGVVVTASHNPSEYNGFKIWDGESTIHSEEIREVYRIMESGDFVRGAGLLSSHDIKPAYLEYIAAQIRLTRPLTVVVDGGNGAAGLLCVEALTKIGATVVPLYCEPDGRFPNHHPDPVVEENIRDLCASVVKHKADCGVGLDGDGDRIGAVDETGRPMYGDALLAIYARGVLAVNPGATIIGEVKCSHLLYKDIADHGGVPVMARTGHSLIKAKMKETGALLAGEMSGHMFFADRYYGFDDAIYAAARFLEVLDKTGARAGELLADWPQTFNTPEIRLDCPDAIKFEVVRLARDHFREKYRIIDVDGVRAVFDDGWGLVRASNTQAVLVLRFEAQSEERLAAIRRDMETPLKEIIAKLSV
ncbi:MAG: phosphomannomutase/phosphoglucomutase [Desulfovibrionaceae bacterium]|nr:phosphomannomutase/phosphoglucomutase [Desulfovibrionaceae bacterium]MBF0514513.1 phosphomannomutase/phosphoglucomutase [Desulfovibrionaceae bacterium]